MKKILLLATASFIVLPAAAASAGPPKEVMVPMTDGIKLSTDVYLPETGAGPWPAVLIRSSYGKGMVSGTAENFRRWGLAAIVQDTRGLGKSEGVDCVFRCDAADGMDTVKWMKNEPWYNGKFALWGISALGILALTLAPEQPEGLKTIWLQQAPANMYDFIFPGGAFREKDVTDWLQIQNNAEYINTIAEHPFIEPWWDIGQLKNRYDSIKVPVFHIAGWYDMFAQDAQEGFIGFQWSGGDGAKGLQKLVAGPWTHTGFGNTQQGELKYPENCAIPLNNDDGLLRKWMLHYLGVQPAPEVIAAVPAVQYYTMGDVDSADAPGNIWRNSEVWPPEAAALRFYLQTGGKLEEICPGADAPRTYTYDPNDPSPTVGGGNMIFDSGPTDQRPRVESRKDALVFSKALTEPLEITGRVRAHVFTSIDQPDTDIHLRLTDVYPNGHSILIADGAARLSSRGRQDGIELLKSREVVEAVVELPTTSIIINKGHKLRAIISSSNYPRYRANPNDGSNIMQASSPRPVKVTVYNEPGRASYIEIPSPGADPARIQICTTPVADGGVSEDGGGSKSGGSGGCSATGL
jgi:predicted acyl esterase